MSVGPIASTGLLPGSASTALAGMQQAQAAVAEAAAQVATGNSDPAVIVDIANAETAFAVNAAVMRTGAAMTRRLLDTLV